MAREKLYTVGEIGRRLREPTFRISYIIDKHHLEPVERAGIIRQFSEAQVQDIQAAVQRLRVKR